MLASSTTAFLLQRIGPYHHARLRAYALRNADRLSVVEYRPSDSVYQWKPVNDEGRYNRFQSGSRSQLVGLLAKLNPDALVCVGYSDPEIQQAVLWGIGKGKALVVCSDSNWGDEIRVWTKERFKRRLIMLFGAALVSGSLAEQYMESLGLHRSRQFRPWDVVDNEYFEERSEYARAHFPNTSRASPFSGPYFLCVARFVRRKNLKGLLAAYSIYAARSGGMSWPLLICGGGPLEAELRAEIDSAQLGDKVKIAGFLQYGDLPAYFGLAGAVILPSLSDQWGLVVNEAMAAGVPVLVSSRCGCAPDLVRDNENGFIFDPEDSIQLAGRMHEVEGLDPERRAAMGRRSREIIACYSPMAFAEGLARALICARAWRPGRASWVTRLLVEAMARRPVPIP